MIKTLRFMLVSLLMMLCGTVFAEKVTMKYTGTETANMTGENDAALLGLDASKWSVVAAKGGNQNFPGLNKAGDIRLYYHANGSNTITVSALDGAIINSISMTFTGNTYKKVSVTADDKTVQAGDDGSYTINSSSFVLGNANTTNVQVRISELVINYTANTSDTRADTYMELGEHATTGVIGKSMTLPTASVHEVTGAPLSNVTVTWESSAENVASIANGAISFNAAGTTTITASFAGDNSYKPCSESFTLTVKEAPTTVTNIAELTALENNKEFVFTGEALIVAKPTDKHVYITDATGAALIYTISENSADAAVGKTIAGNWTGKVSIFRKLFEAVPDAPLVMKDGDAVAVKYDAVDASFINENNVNRVVKLKGITEYTVDDKKNIAIKIGETEVVGYNQFGLEIAAAEDGKTYEMTGAISRYNDNIQFQPIEIKEEIHVDLSTAIVNGDMESEYTIFTSPKNDRDIYQPEGWTVTYEGGEENDMTSLNSECTQWNQFSGKPQLAEGGNNTYWIRFRWGNSEKLTLSQDITLPAGSYRLKADAFFNGANGGSATISANDASTSVTGNGAWGKYSVDFTVTDETPVTIAFNLTQTAQVENIAGFDNFVIVDAVADAKVELETEILIATELLNNEFMPNGRDELSAAIRNANTLLSSTDLNAILEGIATLKAAEETFRAANPEPVFEYQKYVVQNIESGKYWGAANNWGTKASLVEHPEYLKLVPNDDGTYGIESQVNNGGESYYFNGDFMDNGTPVKLTIRRAKFMGYKDDNETEPVFAYTIANGDNYYGWDGTSTVLGKNLAADSENALWVIASLDEAKAELANATVQEPMDATILIEDHNFGRNNRYANKWVYTSETENGGTNFTLSGGEDNSGSIGNNCAESYHANFTLSQVLANAPAGVYALTAQGFYRQDGSDNENLPVFYANDETQTFPLKTGNEGSMGDAGKSFLKGLYTIDPIYVQVEEGGTLTIGAKLEGNYNLWCIWDNFALTYYGADASIDAVKNAAKIAQLYELLNKVKELYANEAIVYTRSQLETIVSMAPQYESMDPSQIDAATIETGISVLQQVIDHAEAELTAADVLPKMKAFTEEETNFYTQEAFDTYYTQWNEKYTSGMLTKAEAAALQDPNATTGWHGTNTVDDLLMSVWDEVPENWSSYHVNTWSTEGGTDGTNFVVPFIEYWTGDGESLAEKTLNATINGLNEGDIYDVTAWVRVRIKNGAEAPATGITFQVNNNDPVSVTDGAQIGTTQFYIKEVKTYGAANANGGLDIHFNVAADNNVSWLAFKNLKYAFNQDLTTGINSVNADKLQHDGIFNLNGQKVEKIQKGLYIINGKKVVMK
ncbi:MAG: Ig-like domain repeat protein [Prevotella sp.]|nr:Ig-like domain repeat protein [Prevotella sp.]